MQTFLQGFPGHGGKRGGRDISSLISPLKEVDTNVKCSIHFEPGFETYRARRRLACTARAKSSRVRTDVGQSMQPSVMLWP